jgi:fructokinase
MKKILCFGEALIDFLNTGHSAQGPLNLAVFCQYPGGAPANAAVAVARLGGKAYFAGQVGQDMFGNFLRDALVAYGVNTSFLLQHPTASTALAFVALDDKGERSFSFHRHQTADVILSADQVSDVWFSGDTILHFCSNTLTTAEIANCTHAVVGKAKAAGNLISFDVNLRHNLWASGQADRAVVNPLVAQSDLVKFSRDELEFLAQGQLEAYIEHNLAAGCQLILVTDGARPIEYFTKTCTGRITPPQVQAVDTTAGGDAFIGGFLYALSGQTDLAGLFHQPQKLEQLLHFAAHCGAYAVTQPGAFTALPDLAAVKARLTAQGHDLHEFPSSLFIGA